jgi:hypothetical protein
VTPKEPARWSLDDLGLEGEAAWSRSSGRSKWALAGLDITERLVIREEMTSGEAGATESSRPCARIAD